MLATWLDAESEQWLGLRSRARETFARLLNSQVAEVECPRPEDGSARRVHSLLDELPEWDQIRRACRGDRWGAAQATLSLLQGLLQELSPFPLARTQPS
ncbi:MAG: hypothetical protein AAF627_09920 [Myxococcota bacterium]